MTHGTPAGIIAETIHRLRLTLADSDELRALTGTSNRIDCIKRVHGQDLPVLKYDSNGEVPLSELERLRPYAQVYLPDAGLSLIKDSTDSFELGMTINVMIDSHVPEGLSDEAADNWFLNRVGLLVFDIMSPDKFAAPYGDLKSLTVITAPFRARRQTHPGLGDCFATQLSLTFGTGTSEGGG